MARAIALADCPLFSTLPNPRVGAVIVKSGRILGEGFHQGPGFPHAEVEAIRNARKRGARSLKGATLYCTLEPCQHLNKRTPPCAPQIVQEEFARIVIGHKDPNPQVQGRGIRLLKKAGLLVHVGCLKEECEALNQDFIKNQQTGLPYITLKLAMTFDGLMADDDGRSQWITNKNARAGVHKIRARADAMGVGKRTFLLDDPQLTTRLPKMATRKNKILVFGHISKKQILKSATFKVNAPLGVFAISKTSNIRQSLKQVYKQERICHLLVEGGPALASSLLKQKCIDKIIIIYGRGFLGGGGRHRLGAQWRGQSLSRTLPWQPERAETISAPEGKNLWSEGRLHIYKTS